MWRVSPLTTSSAITACLFRINVPILVVYEVMSRASDDGGRRAFPNLATQFGGLFSPVVWAAVILRGR